jgi:hypothetical protein
VRPISHYFDLHRWRRLIDGQVEVYRRKRGDDRLDAFMRELGPVQHATGKSVIIADAMYPNPNHFFRVRLFLEALSQRSESFDLLGVVYRLDDHRSRRALERIGFNSFVGVEDDQEFRLGDFLATADNLLSNAKTHADLLAIELPYNLPACVWYDTALKIARHPQPPLGDPVWRDSLAATLRYIAIYEREIANRRISYVVLSQPWKSEWTALLWLALHHGIPVYCLTTQSESVRIRRLRTQQDFLTPVEHLPFRTFSALAPESQARMALLGHQSFARRTSGASTDINARSAFRPDSRITDRERARLALSGQSERPIVLVLGHVWFDFPHSFGMHNFTDFLDWTEFTLRTIRDARDCIWLLKPHPTENWYGNFFLSDIAKDLPDHVRLLPTATDAATTFVAADAVVTVHGTGGLEALANGIPVIFADSCYFSDWRHGQEAESREHYAQLLHQAHRLPVPTRKERDNAAACFVLAVGEPPAEAGALRLSCDSFGHHLYDEIIERWSMSASQIEAERDRLVQFLSQDEIDSFAAFHLTRMVAGREAASELMTS